MRCYFRLKNSGKWYIAVLAVAFLLLFRDASLRACVFCAKLGNTFAEDFQQADAAVVAKLIKYTPPDTSGATPAQARYLLGTAKFVVTRQIKESVGLDRDAELSIQTTGEFKAGQKYLLVGFGKEPIEWARPTELSEAVERYLIDSRYAPKEGPERLSFFLPYLDDKETLIVEDAYKEFAAVPYATVRKLKEKFDREKLLAHVTSPETKPAQRRLFCLMLGLSGRPEDAPAVLEQVRKVEDKTNEGLDALLACYVMLAGEPGIELIESRYLGSSQAKYTQITAAVAAVRFHVDEEQVIPRSRLLAACYRLFARPELADLVINDLIRWEDWTVADKLVDLFKRPKEESQFLRTHVVRYLKARPFPDSRERIEELRRIDPEAVEQAEVIVSEGVATRALADKQSEKKKLQEERKAKRKAAAEKTPEPKPHNESSTTTRPDTRSSAGPSSPPATDNVFKTPWFASTLPIVGLLAVVVVLLFAGARRKSADSGS